jgi:3',5'-cyclic AMP phosphodiesterase CpdA
MDPTPPPRPSAAFASSDAASPSSAPATAASGDDTNGVLTWIHFGDLHASAEDRWRSVRDLRAMIAAVDTLPAGSVDFAFLPGDNANHGEAVQYGLIARSMARLHLPWHAIPGDHDFEPGDLAAFHDGLHVRELPYGEFVKGRRCLFLDIVSHGGGGPDFRLGDAQLQWLRDQLVASRGDSGRPVVFMHAFPGDLAEDAQAVAELFADHGVLCVDTGHTHYNELVNDGAVVYSATRSTGQIEEGRVGFSVQAVDGSAVSWRFKPAAQGWPFVLVTSPADHRLVTDAAAAGPTPDGRVVVRAKVLGRDIVEVVLEVDDDAGLPMQPVDGHVGLWAATLDRLDDGEHRLRVRAVDGAGGRDVDTIVVRVAADAGTGESSAASSAARRKHLGEDVHSIGAWADHGVLGSQLGPNKHGKKW